MKPPVRAGTVLLANVLPGPDAWNAAVEHSRANPTHILGPYEDDEGVMQMCCDGDGDPYEPSNCDFSTRRGGGCGDGRNQP